MIGSSSTGAARRAASRNAMDPAILNAISDESTSCDEPSSSVTVTSSTGYPARMPVVSASRTPASTDGMNSFGIAPPTMRLSKTKPFPGCPGTTPSLTWPY